MTLDRSCYVIADRTHAVTATTISTDGGDSVYCECRIVGGLLLEAKRSNTGVECVMTMLRCPLQQTLDLTIT